MAIVKRGQSYGVVIYERGRRVWVGTRPTKTAAKELEAKALLERHLPGSDLTVEQFAATWLERYPRPKVSTMEHYRQQIRGFVEVHGHRKLSALSRTEMRVWAVQNQSLARVAQTMLGDAFRDGLMPSNPLAGLRLPESRGRRDRPRLTEDQVARLVEIAGEVHGEYGQRVYGPMIRVAAYTGLRPGEMHGLRWTDIDLQAETIHVQRQYSPKARAFTTPKNGRSRLIQITPPAAEALTEIPRTATAAVFVTKNQVLFSGRVSHYYWSPVRAAFGDPDLDFYELRHFFGTTLARRGLGAPEIARAMGHTDSGQTALRRYINISEEEARERVKQAFADRPDLRVVSSEGGEV
jgi:integrase